MDEPRTGPCLRWLASARVLSNGSDGSGDDAASSHDGPTHGRRVQRRVLPRWRHDVRRRLQPQDGTGDVEGMANGAAPGDAQVMLGYLASMPVHRRVCVPVRTCRHRVCRVQRR